MSLRWFQQGCGRGLALAILWLGGFAMPEACAHNPETSYLRVVIDGDAMRTRLTYDFMTLNRMVALDDDHDRQVSREEFARHVPEIVAFLSEHVGVEATGYASGIGTFVGFDWPLDAGRTIPEKDYHSALALVAFHFERVFEDELEDVAFDFALFDRLGERHSILGSFVHAGQATEVVFTRFEPDYEYVTGHEVSLWRRLWQFFRMGVAHIFLGFDHLCFLAALILVARPKELVKVVTAFTVAHTCTLILATLDWVSLPTRLVEAGIAASIVYVAWENLTPRERPHRWVLSFVFGLVHGFGFAEVLRGMSLPADGLVRCLLSFNLGVEAGQLAIVGCLIWPMLRLRGSLSHEPFVRRASWCLLALGLAWFCDRVVGLGWMPF